jgi:transcriptional regulator with XRE-family HTH domain
MGKPLEQCALLAGFSPDDIARLCGVSPSTAAKWKRGDSRTPVAALKLLTFWSEGLLPNDEGKMCESPRVRAVKLRARMLEFNDIYNAAWFVRASDHGSPDYRAEKVVRFMKTLRLELENCRDPEALIFAIADALTAFPHGLPWER